jgi:[NiFe] hydrogenase diaphorase moiety large subunit
VRPGLYEYPFGVKVSQVLADCGAESAVAVQIGGASGLLLSDRDFERHIAFEDVPTAGAFMVFGHGRDLFEAVHNFAHFFEHESCGFCTPCRVGTAIVRRLMDKIDAGHGTHADVAEIRRLHDVMVRTSHCGLGQTAATAIVESMNKFQPAWDRRLTSHSFEPAFDLDGSLETARRITGRCDIEAHVVQEFEP